MALPVVNNQGLLEFTKKCYATYGKAVVTQRALVDFRDGLKPVHRRIIWYMHTEGIKSSGGFKKSARTVGGTMGAYHPHGDLSIYEALVAMTQKFLPVNLIEGQGNFGTFVDNAAAHRYTECRLTKYADKYLLDPDYLKVIAYHPTYDWGDKEPLYLPSLLPNLLFNGSSGIAVGVTAGIPPFEPKGVLHLANRALAGKEITPALCVKHLVVNHRNGSHLVSDDQEYTTLFETGEQSLAFGVDYEEDAPNRQMIVTGITPVFNTASIIVKLEKQLKDKFHSVSSMPDKKNPIRFVIKFKASVDRNEIPALCTRVYKMLFCRQAYKTNVTLRKAEDDVLFSATNIPNLIMDWALYRIDLEKRMQKQRMLDLKEQIAKQDLLVLAANNAMFITKTVRSDAANPRKIIMDKLGITDDDAKYILGFTFQQISKLSEAAIQKKIAGLQAEYKVAKGHYMMPADKCQADITEALTFFEKAK